MNFCSGGTLAEKLEQSPQGLPEAQVKQYFRSLISAIHYCLEVHQISHRDIKPENVMLDDAGEVYLTDFGCSEFFKPTNDDLSKATKGSYLFLAPEMFSGDKANKIIKGRAIDIWAAGVTLFNLLTNKYPWNGKGPYALAGKVRNEEPDFEPLGPGREDLKELLKRIFEKDPAKRIDIYELIDDPWVTDNGENMIDLDLLGDDSSLSQKQLSDDSGGEMGSVNHNMSF